MLEERLGAGGMGVVFRATYVRTGQKVAVKFIPSDLLENERVAARFQRELRILTKLKHPSIVRCYGGGKHGDRLYYAMELVEGGSLASLLRQRKRLSWEATVDYGRQIASALAHAHSQGIVHRDLKPANLLLTRDGKLKLGDFGLARDAGATQLTVAGRALGTFAYMAPEMIRGEPPPSYRADLYSLGCVLHEMLTGRPPFQAESPAEMFYLHLESKPARVSTIAMDCPIWLEALVAQLLEKDPAKRPLDATAVDRSLSEIEERVVQQASVAGHTIFGGPTTLSIERDVSEIRRLVAPRRKKPAADAGPFYERTWFLAGCLALLVAGVAYALWPASEETLFARAQPLMESADPVAWQTARREYLEPLLERFPQGKHAAWARQQVDVIEMHLAEQRLRNHARLGRLPTSEAERLYGEAWRYEQFGDRVTALERYRALLDLLPDDESNRPFLNLARRQIAAIESNAEPTDRLQLVESALERAEEQHRQGQVLEARKTWSSVVALYADNQELEPLVARARKRLEGLDDSAAPDREVADPEARPSAADVPSPVEPVPAADGSG